MYYLQQYVRALQAKFVKLHYLYIIENILTKQICDRCSRPFFIELITFAAAEEYAIYSYLITRRNYSKEQIWHVKSSFDGM